MSYSIAKVQYVPWQTQDLEGLVKSLPNLHQTGASRWISEFEDATTGKKLAIGDVKAILARIIGHEETMRLLQRAGKGALNRVGSTDQDGTEMDRYQNAIWTQLRANYPARPDLSNLQGENLEENEHPTVYYQKIKKKWKLETDQTPDGNNLHTTMFRKLVLDGLPESVKSKLEDVVGLYYKPEPEFCEHLAHTVDKHRGEKIERPGKGDIA